MPATEVCSDPLCAQAGGVHHLRVRDDVGDGVRAGCPRWALDRIGRTWWAFHLAHPEVYTEVVRVTRTLVHRGHRHLGIAMVWEVVRYNTMLGARPDEDVFRLNNNHKALYARLIMEVEPDLAGIFAVRSRRWNS